MAEMAEKVAAGELDAALTTEPVRRAQYRTALRQLVYQAIVR
mgnify:CR=1 FL=1